MRRLFPEPGEIDPAESVGGLAGRETLVLNMVSSVDGRAALDGRSGGLSNPGDREVFHLLRAQADAILVGAGTVVTEGYRRVTKNDELRARRVAAGLEPEPILAIVARTPDLPAFDPAARPVVYTGEPAEALADLRAAHGVRCVLAEGGPRLNARLFAAGLVDELFLTLSPLVVGGTDPLTVVRGELAAPRPLALRQVVEADGALMLRYAASG